MANLSLPSFGYIFRRAGGVCTRGIKDRVLLSAPEPLLEVAEAVGWLPLVPELLLLLVVETGPATVVPLFGPPGPDGEEEE